MSAVGATSAAMANAAFSTLVSQATISTINNGGNLGAVLKEMGSSASIKQLATSVATAGALQGLDKAMGVASAAPAASNAASQPAASNLFSWDTFNRVTSHSVVTAGINTTINGSHFADAFKASLLSNIQGEVGKSTANWVGDQGIKFDAANSPLAEAGKIAAHGVTSGAIAEITGGKFAAGAAGAAGGAMSELASSWSSQVFSNTEHQVALNKVLGGLAAVAVTGDENDFDTGADRAETVHRYNALEHMYLPSGLIDAGMAAESLGKFMADNGATPSEISQAQNDLTRGVGTGAQQPATEFLKQWVLFMSNSAAMRVGRATGMSSVVTGGVIGGAANGSAQIITNDNKPFNYVDALIAVGSGSLTQGKGIIGTEVISVSGAYIGSKIKGEEPESAMVGAAIGSASGKVVSDKLKPIVKENAAEILGNITGSAGSEAAGRAIEDISSKERMNK
ncbi:DUF637 domain-containing protein [Aeromonas bestiarum]|uniref:DUF637 domain-containing protein n=1 Tax=Aeromonas bestiarum TaxID=105751 RepID=UPI003D1F6D0A